MNKRAEAQAQAANKLGDTPTPQPLTKKGHRQLTNEPDTPRGDLELKLGKLTEQPRSRMNCTREPTAKSTDSLELDDQQPSGAHIQNLSQRCHTIMWQHTRPLTFQ